MSSTQRQQPTRVFCFNPADRKPPALRHDFLRSNPIPVPVPVVAQVAVSPCVPHVVRAQPITRAPMVHPQATHQQHPMPCVQTGPPATQHATQQRCSFTYASGYPSQHAPPVYYQRQQSHHPHQQTKRTPRNRANTVTSETLVRASKQLVAYTIAQTKQNAMRKPSTKASNQNKQTTNNGTSQINNNNTTPKALQEVLASGATTNQQLQRQLQLAVTKGDQSLANKLVLAGADPTVSDSFGYTLLHTAAQYGHLDVTRWLVESRATDASAKNHWGNTALHLAASTGQKNIVHWLIKSGHCVVDSLSSTHATALHVAATKHHLSTVELLLKLRADHSIRDDKGNTALHLTKSKLVAELLICKGASIASLNNQQDQALHNFDETTQQHLMRLHERSTSPSNVSTDNNSSSCFSSISSSSSCSSSMSEEGSPMAPLPQQQQQQQQQPVQSVTGEPLFDVVCGKRKRTDTEQQNDQQNDQQDEQESVEPHNKRIKTAE